MKPPSSVHEKFLFAVFTGKFRLTMCQNMVVQLLFQSESFATDMANLRFFSMLGLNVTPVKEIHT